MTGAKHLLHIPNADHPLEFFPPGSGNGTKVFAVSVSPAAVLCCAVCAVCVCAVLCCLVQSQMPSHRRLCLLYRHANHCLSVHFNDKIIPIIAAF